MTWQYALCHEASQATAVAVETAAACDGAVVAVQLVGPWLSQLRGLD